MRLSDIEVLVRVLSEACQKARSTGRIDIDVLTNQTQFVNSLRALWAQIPEKTRRSISQKSPEANHGCSQKSNLPKVTISEDVVDHILQWSESPLSFFQENGNELDLGFSPIGQLYKYLTEVDTRRTVDTIRTRFIKIAFHRLKERLGLRYMHSNNIDVVAQIISNSGIVKCELNIIKRKIVQWTDLGGRTEALCRRIGSSATDEDSHLGNLFCLPEDYHDKFIRVLKYNGPERDKEIQRIKDRGILDVQDRASLDQLAAKLFNVLWVEVKKWIDQYIRSSESNSSRNLQYMQCFRIEQRVPRSNASPTQSPILSGRIELSDDPCSSTSESPHDEWSDESSTTTSFTEDDDSAQPPPKRPCLDHSSVRPHYFDTTAPQNSSNSSHTTVTGLQTIRSYQQALTNASQLDDTSGMAEHFQNSASSLPLVSSQANLPASQSTVSNHPLPHDIQWTSQPPNFEYTSILTDNIPLPSRETLPQWSSQPLNFEYTSIPDTDNIPLLSQETLSQWTSQPLNIPLPSRETLPQWSSQPLNFEYTSIPDTDNIPLPLRETLPQWSSQSPHLEGSLGINSVHDHVIASTGNFTQANWQST